MYMYVCITCMYVHSVMSSASPHSRWLACRQEGDHWLPQIRSLFWWISWTPSPFPEQTDRLSGSLEGRERGGEEREGEREGEGGGKEREKGRGREGEKERGGERVTILYYPYMVFSTLAVSFVFDNIIYSLMVIYTCTVVSCCVYQYLVLSESSNCLFLGKW